MGVRPPAASLMAVRELEPLTAKPWLSALAMLAAPMPMNSWLASMLYPLRAAKLGLVSRPLLSDTSASAATAGTSVPEQLVRHRRRDKRWQAGRHRPDHLHPKPLQA